MVVVPSLFTLNSLAVWAQEYVVEGELGSFWHTLLENAQSVQLRTVQYSYVQYSTVQYSKVQYSTF